MRWEEDERGEAGIEMAGRRTGPNLATRSLGWDIEGMGRWACRQVLESLIMKWSESVRGEISVLFGFWWSPCR